MVSYENVNEKNLKKLTKHGYKFIKVKTKHENKRLSGPISIVLYNTGKLLLQGKKDLVKDQAKLIEYLGIVEEKKAFSGIAIGTDETLKGDTFGGIVVCGFMADDKIREELKELGVRDSKELLKPDIVKLARELKEKYPKNYHIENIFPKEYNKLNLKMNVTEIMNKLHERCYKKLAGRKKKIVHVVDLYPGCNIGDIQKKKAESKYLEVAAASIIARCHGLMQIRELEQKAGFFIPLGSTHVGSALIELKKKSLNPENYVKMKFKNVEEFFS